MEEPQTRLLRMAFLLGANTDALAVVPMLVPPAARLLWGIDAEGGAYRFAMGFGATLMLGWTGLLLWAYPRPRRRLASLRSSRRRPVLSESFAAAVEPRLPFAGRAGPAST